MRPAPSCRSRSASAICQNFRSGSLSDVIGNPSGLSYRHQDFSEDTYRTLTAVDSVATVLDASRKGIEEQTRKLFEVRRLRDGPIITFVNKLDREGRDPSTCWTRSSSLWRST